MQNFKLQSFKPFSFELTKTQDRRTSFRYQIWDVVKDKSKKASWDEIDPCILDIHSLGHR